MYEFLKQSDHPRKHTPGIDNYRDHHTNKDGFGFAWAVDKKWHLYKQPCIYHKDAHLENKINHMKKEIVIGQLQNNEDSKIHRHRGNIQPFLFENQVFAHNGRIESGNSKDFHKTRTVLEQFMAPDLAGAIHGDTDTEFLFFLFLSILRRQKGRHGAKRLQMAMLELFGIFEHNRIEITANFIYADHTHVLITRYIHYRKSDYKREQIPQSLYYVAGGHGEFLVTSEPITAEYEIFPENTMMILNWHTMKKIHTRISGGYRKINP